MSHKQDAEVLAALRAVDDTLMVHGHVDAGTPLHNRIQTAVATALDQLDRLKADDAIEIAIKVREQNWKIGGHHVMDGDEAAAMIQDALDKAHQAGMREVSRTWFTYAGSKDARAQGCIHWPGQQRCEVCGMDRAKPKGATP